MGEQLVPSKGHGSSVVSHVLDCFVSPMYKSMNYSLHWTVDTCFCMGFVLSVDQTISQSVARVEINTNVMLVKAPLLLHHRE